MHSQHGLLRRAGEGHVFGSKCCISKPQSQAVLQSYKCYAVLQRKYEGALPVSGVSSRADGAIPVGWL